MRNAAAVALRLAHSTATAYMATDNPRSGAHEPRRVDPSPASIPRILPSLITLDTAVIADAAIVGGVLGGAIGAIGPQLDDLLISTATAYMATDNPRSGAHEPQRVVPNPQAFPGLKPGQSKTYVRGGGRRRRRWVDKNGNIYEEDTQHGTLEKYDKRGRRLGEYDPETGAQTKGPDATRRIEP